MAKKDPCLTCDEEMMACYDCPHNPDGMEVDDPADIVEAPDGLDVDPDDESAYEYDDGYDASDEEELTLD